MYEAMLSDGFDVASEDWHAVQRLAVPNRRAKRYQDEIRILADAIAALEAARSPDSAARLRQRRDKAEVLQAKAEHWSP